MKFFAVYVENFEVRYFLILLNPLYAQSGVINMDGVRLLDTYLTLDLIPPDIRIENCKRDSNRPLGLR